MCVKRVYCLSELECFLRRLKRSQIIAITQFENAFTVIYEVE